MTAWLSYRLMLNCFTRMKDKTQLDQILSSDKVMKGRPLCAPCTLVTRHSAEYLKQSC